MFKKNKIAIAFLAIFSIALISFGVKLYAGNGDSESVSGPDQVGYLKSDGSTYALRITSSGHVIPGTRGGADLGAPVLRWGYIYGSSVGISGFLNVSSSGFINFGNPPAYQASTGTSIPYSGSYINLASTGAGFTFNAQPHLATATAKNGDYVMLINNTTQTFVFRDANVGLTNSGMRLSTSPYSLGPTDTIEFVFSDSTGAWIQKGGSDNK